MKKNTKILLVCWLAFMGWMITGCSSESSTCDCDEDQICLDGKCQPRPDGGGGGETQDSGNITDAGMEASDINDSGSDNQLEIGDVSGDWVIVPGVGIGPLRINQSPADTHTLTEVRVLLDETGTATNANFTLAFMGDTLRVTGIDVNDNQTFDGDDHIISLTAREGSAAKTEDNLGPGSSLTQIHSKYHNPDHYADLPAYNEFPGGRVDSYFKEGLLVNYDEQDVAKTLSVIRKYPQPPDGQIDPVAKTLKFGNTIIECGNGLLGSLRTVHRGILGEPDYPYSFKATINQTEYQMYLDSYRIMGMEFFGGDHDGQYIDIKGLIAVAFYPLFYGKTAAGHGIGSTRAEWETELGSNPVQKTSESYNGVLFVYTVYTNPNNPQDTTKFTIIYTNDGASQDDRAVMLLLNFIEK